MSRMHILHTKNSCTTNTQEQRINRIKKQFFIIYFLIFLWLSRQLDTHVRGSISLKLGLRRSVTTSLSYNDNRRRHAEIGLVVGVPQTYLVCSMAQHLSDNEAMMRASLRLGLGWLLGDAVYERKVSRYNRAGCALRVQLPAGNVRVKLKMIRASQTYQLDIVLCEQLDYALTSFVYGVMLPSLGYLVLKQLLRPYLEQWQDTTEMERRLRSKEAVEIRRREAKQAINLMRETAARIRDQEEKKKGLVIIEARYGDLFTTRISNYNYDSRVTDVTIPLQTLVQDSKLLLCDVKSQLPGFYDPCPGVDKMLVVRYRFRALEHRITVKDAQALLIPKQSHRMDVGNGGVPGASSN